MTNAFPVREQKVPRFFARFASRVAPVFTRSFDVLEMTPGKLTSGEFNANLHREKSARDDRPSLEKDRIIFGNEDRISGHFLPENIKRPNLRQGLIAKVVFLLKKQ